MKKEGDFIASVNRLKEILSKLNESEIHSVYEMSQEYVLNA